MQELEDELRHEIDQLGQEFDIENLELETVTIPPRKSDLKIGSPVILWTPWQVDSTGEATALF